MIKMLLICTLVVSSFASGLINENILMGMPQNFKVGYKAYNPKTHLSVAELIPKNESVQDWSQMITLDIYHKNLPLNAKKYTLMMKDLWKRSCAKSYTKDIAHGKENGYDFSLLMLFCPKSKVTNKSEYTWLKAIKGKDSFYVVQKAFTIPPNKSQIIKTMQYLRRVQVCDSRLGNCPKIGKH
ncbi:MAG: hypothetical protein R3331_09170 [Sulfurospirillaceae bacterium]|nr:hypothetical protein [Sulfurospirillaceae bacterium]